MIIAKIIYGIVFVLFCLSVFPFWTVPVKKCKHCNRQQSIFVSHKHCDGISCKRPKIGQPKLIKRK